jgi:hypothetical protein
MEDVLAYKVEKFKALDSSINNEEIIEAINSKKK